MESYNGSQNRNNQNKTDLKKNHNKKITQYKFRYRSEVNLGVRKCLHDGLVTRVLCQDANALPNILNNHTIRQRPMSAKPE
jgi:hypothetical protein